MIYVTILIVLSRNGGNSVKKRFLGTFLGVFGLNPLTPYELRPNFWSNKVS